MRKLLLLLIAFASTSAFAETPAKIPSPDELMKQETVSLGGNRFLIFSGTANGRGQYGYSLDLIKITAGIPHFDPLFIEEYNPDTNTAKLEYGIAFMASSYHFDKASNTLNYTTEDEQTHVKQQLKYKLDVDIFKLQEVVSQETASCPKEPCKASTPKTVYKASANAKTY